MKLITSEKADAEVIGHVIILGITMVGLSMIVLYGVPAIYSLKDMANIKNVEQTFTVLDSRASRVVLGESPLQITNINLGSGSLTVEPNSTNTKSYMVIKSKNDTFNVTIPMGKIKYTLGDRIVAYEGGGVWSKYLAGSVMLSPPEFHFNGVTLTLPVITFSGNTSTGGTGSAAITFMKAQTLVLYPNASFKNRTNPVNFTNTGKVYVNITSDFYDAWADYARGLGYTLVTTNSTNHATDIELTVVPDTLGERTSITNPITFRGLDPSDQTPLENFSFRITSAGNNLNWDLRANSGNKRLIFYLKDDNNWAVGKKVTLRIGYQEGSGSGTVEAWKGDSLYTIQQDNYIYVDLLNNSINLTYTKGGVGSNNANLCTPNQIGGGNDFSDNGFSWGESFTEGTTQKSLYNITQHYLWKMAQGGDIIFNQCGSQSPSTASTVVIDYNTTGALTYLQITQNNANVTIR